MFTYVIRGLAPETDYEVQVCQPEFNVCGNCTVMFTTPAAEGTVYMQMCQLCTESSYIHTLSWVQSCILLVAGVVVFLQNTLALLWIWQYLY